MIHLIAVSRTRSIMKNQKEDAKGRCGDRMRVAVRSGFKCHIFNNKCSRKQSAGTGSEGCKRVSNTTQNKATLTKTSSVVTSDVSSVVESVMPSIVSITNMSVQQVQSFFGGTSQQEVTSAGTGIIIEKTDSELLIVTIIMSLQTAIS